MTKRNLSAVGILRDFFSYPMRVFFLSAAGFGIIASVGLIFLPQYFIALHQFIFIHCVCGAAFAGFLYTAIPSWSHYKKSLLPFSIPSFFLLILAFLGEIFFSVGGVIIVFFWGFLMLSCAYFLALDKNTQQYGIVLSLIGILALVALNAYSKSPSNIYALLHLFVLSIMIIAFRVSMVLAQEVLDNVANEDSVAEFNKDFGADFSVKSSVKSNAESSVSKHAKSNIEFNALKRAKINTESSAPNNIDNKIIANASLLFVPNAVYKNIAIVLLCALCVCEWLEFSAVVSGFLSLGVGFVSLGRLSEWHYRAFLMCHYTRIVYVLMLFMGLFYVALGGVLLLDLPYKSALFHSINLGVILGFIFLVFNVAGLRHSGQILCFPALSRLGFVALFLSAISRGILWIFIGAFYIVIPAVLVGLVCAGYIISFFRIFRDFAFSDDE